MATTPTTLDDNAARPQKASTAAGSVEQAPLPDQIEYDRYKATKTARANGSSPLAGLRISKIGFGGTTGDA